MTQNISRHFQNLLLEYSQQTRPEDRMQVENILWQEFGAEQAVFVLDMSEFSLLSRKYGIIHYLSMVRRMQLTAEPIITSHDGRVVKFEADNCFALFPDTLQAVRAAVAIQFALDAANLITTPELDIRVSIGIDYGHLLLVGEIDCFGDAVNRASKLGEDIASAGEILVTQDAMDHVPEAARIAYRPVQLSISGISIPACVVRYRPEE